MTLSTNVTVASGTQVTIAAGATINVGANVTITVEGTLTAANKANHAKLTGSGWTGIVVASGGTLSLDGVDITGASAAIHVEAGDTAAEYDDATITGSKVPFNVDKGGTLGTKSSNVTGTLGISTISGSFTASYLDYDSNGVEGITTMDPSAELSIEDSTLHGGMPVHDALTSAVGAAKFHVAYTELTDNHCGFHFDTVSEFDISNVNDHGNLWGSMFYGSGGSGPFTVTDSNLDSNSAYAYDAQGQNSPITLSGCYVSGATNDPSSVVSATNAAGGMVAGTGPRPQ
jgi:hypothetical protein